MTPAHLHFVRNHGAVPRVDDAALSSWTIRVHGLVDEEMELTLGDLKSRFEVVTLPVTLVCAGNRRKEQNVHRALRADLFARDVYGAVSLARSLRVVLNSTFPTN